MVGIMKDFEGCARAEALGQPNHQIGVRECIASSLQEEHRNFHLEQVISTLVRRSRCGM